MLNKIFTVALTTVCLIACENDNSSAPVIACAPGTQLNASSDACEPHLSDGLSVNEAGQIIVNVMGDDTQAAIETAREEGRAEGVASVDITTDNKAAFDEGLGLGLSLYLF